MKLVFKKWVENLQAAAYNGASKSILVQWNKDPLLSKTPILHNQTDLSNLVTHHLEPKK